MQALHPLVMAASTSTAAGVPTRFRLAATTGYVATITYGDRDTARRAAQRVRAVHEHVHGTDPVTRPALAATDPRCCCGCTRPWWIPRWPPPDCSACRCQRGTPTEYVSDMTVAAELAGAPRDLIPRDVRSRAVLTASSAPGRRRAAASDACAAAGAEPAGSRRLALRVAQERRCRSARDGSRASCSCEPSPALTPSSACCKWNPFTHAADADRAPGPNGRDRPATAGHTARATPRPAPPCNA